MSSVVSWNDVDCTRWRLTADSCDEQAMNILKAVLFNDKTIHKNCFRLYKKCAKEAAKGTLVLDEEGLLTLSLLDFIRYKSWKVPKLPMRCGTVLFTSVAFLSEVLFLIFLFQFHIIFQSFPLAVMLLYVASSFTVMWASHVLVHLAVGKLSGINFHGYFIFKPSFYKSRWLKNKPFPIRVPGIKYELGSFLTVPRKRRRMMFVSAPIISNAIFIVNYAILVTQINVNDALVIGIGALMITTWYLGSLALSYWFHGDLWKAHHLT